MPAMHILTPYSATMSSPTNNTHVVTPDPSACATVPLLVQGMNEQDRSYQSPPVRAPSHPLYPHTARRSVPFPCISSYSPLAEIANMNSPCRLQPSRSPSSPISATRKRRRICLRNCMSARRRFMKQK